MEPLQTALLRNRPRIREGLEAYDIYIKVRDFLLNKLAFTLDDCSTMHLPVLPHLMQELQNHPVIHLVLCQAHLSVMPPPPRSFSASMWLVGGDISVTREEKMVVGECCVSATDSNFPCTIKSISS